MCSKLYRTQQDRPFWSEAKQSWLQDDAWVLFIDPPAFGLDTAYVIKFSSGRTDFIFAANCQGLGLHFSGYDKKTKPNLPNPTFFSGVLCGADFLYKLLADFRYFFSPLTYIWAINIRKYIFLLLLYIQYARKFDAEIDSVYDKESIHIDDIFQHWVMFPPLHPSQWPPEDIWVVRHAVICFFRMRWMRKRTGKGFVSPSFHLRVYI